MERIFSYIYHREIKFPKTTFDSVIDSRIGYKNLGNFVLKYSTHNVYKRHLDGYNEELGIGIERNGRQHYERVDAWHRNDNGFRNQISIDKFKKEICDELGIILIVVGFEEINGKLKRIEPEEMQDYIIKQFEKKTGVKIDVPKFDFKKFFINNAQRVAIHLNNKQLDVMRELDGKWHFITDLEQFDNLNYIYGVRQVVMRLYEKGYLTRKKALNPNAIGVKKMLLMITTQ
ncbi:MAG: hypothetical protein EU529_15105 [Promethearchaeota archaeon]|nr:MAG: hypothetical protein EU529_15105 [Candidatus Lokiarchaeota archaeon]